ncbi:GNAT family N-acetyltransferase [Allobranchiibius huperziae]|uniref:Putative GNAT superfamily acetyltransferase n=1 Tax=Allobranchiibius huperziae TaxID=1874116 RepID=A0A853DJK9_9MICO|nr:GNAT family N-acetyltransferase [Allobranchiibius huperziae]NYJ74900.1 putative GNAT superfamily acetyltransferase [Allobranchiibius huperziae]
MSVHVEVGLGAATRAADEAARRAGVVIRELSEVADLQDIVALYDSVWQRESGPLLTAELLRAFAKAGNYVVGAFDGRSLVGACVGFFSAPADSSLHSHISGVSTAARRRNVGFAMKVHQRAWAMRRGASRITWTFDPLVARNAWFNVVKLAADPSEYLTDFYGGMHDGINGPDGSDRLLVSWELGAGSVARACLGQIRPGDAAHERALGACVALGISASGAPVAGSGDASTHLVAVPPDIEGLRATRPRLATDWRIALRESLGGLLTSGAWIDGFDRSGWYVVRQDTAPPITARHSGGAR